jgi:hypothetical protein
MKIYELTTIGFTEVVLATFPDSGVTTIPLDPANSDYAEYLRYTEWVEAGNNPDEFWTQTELTEMEEEI